MPEETLNDHLKRAKDLAAKEVGDAYEKGEHHKIMDWAQKYLENKYVLYSTEALKYIVDNATPPEQG